MPWSRISFAEGFESVACRWMRTVFQQVFLHAHEGEFDALALYVTRHPSGAVTLYLSSRATSRLRAGVRLPTLADCERPASADVELVIGSPLATEPAWCDLSAAERLADAEEAYANIELVESDAAGPQKVMAN